MELRAGSRLKSAVCDTEVIAVKAPGGDMDIRCGGVSMLDPMELRWGIDMWTQMKALSFSALSPAKVHWGLAILC